MKRLSKVEKRWDRAEVSFQNYRLYLRTKTDRFELDLVDLLYVSNFKGGNSSIHQSAESVKQKLLPYGDCLRDIEFAFGAMRLGDLDEDGIAKLGAMAGNFFDLTLRSDTRIYGFGPSYASALASAYFPGLFPILDWRILDSLDIPVRKLYKGSNQVRGIHKHFPEVLRMMHAHLALKKNKTLREYDRELFTCSLRGSL